MTRVQRTVARWSGAALCALGGILCASATLAQTTAIELDLLPVQGNVYMLHGGAAGNLAVQIGKDGVVVVNAMRAGLGARIADKVKTLTPAPIRYIINTSADLHNTAGNAELAALGVFGATDVGPPGATLVAHENVLLRLTPLTRAAKDSFPGPGVPQNVYFLAFKDIHFNGEPIFVMHEPNAHSDADSIVLFRKSDVIAVGDLFTPNEYPVIDVGNGGSADGLVRALNHVLDLAVPEMLQDGGTRIIPGKGRLSNESDVVEYRNMVAIVRDRVRAMIDKGMGLPEIQSARPTLDYDTQYGTGGRVFVESVYLSLTATPSTP